MANLNLRPLQLILPDTRNFDFETYREYLLATYPTNLSIWTDTIMDHERLPGNIDIDEFLVYNGLRLSQWLEDIGYTGETPLYCPAFPDEILSSVSSGITTTNDSPHDKIPWTICYRVERKEPLSRRPPFGGDGKNWKFRICGYFQQADGKIYGVRMRRWETLVDFIIIHRSGLEANLFTRFFEQYMDMNESYFLQAGIAKTVPLGRPGDPEVRLEEGNVHYRKTRRWFETHEFQIYGPVDKITEIDIEAESF